MARFVRGTYEVLIAWHREGVRMGDHRSPPSRRWGRGIAKRSSRAGAHTEVVWPVWGRASLPSRFVLSVLLRNSGTWLPMVAGCVAQPRCVRETIRRPALKVTVYGKDGAWR